MIGRKARREFDGPPSVFHGAAGVSGPEGPAGRSRVEEREGSVGTSLLETRVRGCRLTEKVFDLGGGAHRREFFLSRPDAERGTEPEVAGRALGRPLATSSRGRDRRLGMLSPPRRAWIVFDEPDARPRGFDQGLDQAGFEQGRAGPDRGCSFDCLGAPLGEQRSRALGKFCGRPAPRFSLPAREGLEGGPSRVRPEDARRG